jgi:AAA15 family ATPase/GTPase
MINEIKIEKYNCFENFQLTRLKQLNIIVGENGVGKSALLDYINNKDPLKHWVKFNDPKNYGDSTKHFIEKNKFFLKKIEPDLIDIHFINCSPLNYRQIKIEIKEKKLPLYFMGDAFQRAFQLLFLIHNSQNTVLTIDEIENSIHYTNMQIFWEMLLSAIRELNVQLFISTHSYEMLEYLQKLIENQTYWQEQLNLICLIQHIKIKSSSYSYDGFQSFIENKREFR